MSNPPRLPPPQTWLEFIFSVFDPDQYVLQWQSYGVTLVVPANRGGFTQNIQVPVQVFAFGFSSAGWRTDTGAAPTWPYRIGLKNASNNDWTNGQWASALITGDNGRAIQQTYREWLLPREVSENEVLTVTVDNNVNAASEAITVDAVLWGYEVRLRTKPVERQ